MTATTARTVELRRQGDLALTSIDKRLALVEQSADSNARVADARWSSVDAAIRALDAKMDTVAASMTEPQASPAGRALASNLLTLQSDVREHADFLNEVRGALKLARFALGTSFVSTIGTIVLGVVVLARGQA